MVLIAGHAGSGKTELSKQLATRTGWPLLDKDTLTRPFVEAVCQQLTGDPHDRHSATYLKKIRPLEYQVLMDTVWEVLDHGGEGVIATAPFVAEFLADNWIDDLRFDAEIRDCDVSAVWVVCDPDTLRTRIASRGADRDHWKLLNWPQWVSSLRDPAPQSDLVVVENSRDSVESLGHAADRLVQAL